MKAALLAFQKSGLLYARKTGSKYTGTHRLDTLKKVFSLGYLFCKLFIERTSNSVLALLR
ncbi:hypothetical protein ASG85_30415 [Paenibacillus sp. Soil724D2]|nr:hypothetical protein ASG85_30415 [Paenibacillus sp. Soil724D2]